MVGEHVQETSGADHVIGLLVRVARAPQAVPVSLHVHNVDFAESRLYPAGPQYIILVFDQKQRTTRLEAARDAVRIKSAQSKHQRALSSCKVSNSERFLCVPERRRLRVL